MPIISEDMIVVKDLLALNTSSFLYVRVDAIATSTPLTT
ncbi:unnamed protein product, partial [Allacma fusca]